MHSTYSIILWYCLCVHIIWQPASQAAFPKDISVPVENCLTVAALAEVNIKWHLIYSLKIHVISSSWVAFSGENKQVKLTSYDFQILLLRGLILRLKICFKSTACSLNPLRHPCSANSSLGNCQLLVLQSQQTPEPLWSTCSATCLSSTWRRFSLYRLKLSFELLSVVSHPPAMHLCEDLSSALFISSLGNFFSTAEWAPVPQNFSISLYAWGLHTNGQDLSKIAQVWTRPIWLENFWSCSWAR